jgi:hypothetical protein
VNTCRFRAACGTPVSLLWSLQLRGPHGEPGDWLVGIPDPLPDPMPARPPADWVWVGPFGSACDIEQHLERH